MSVGGWKKVINMPSCDDELYEAQEILKSWEKRAKDTMKDLQMLIACSDNKQKIIEAEKRVDKAHDIATQARLRYCTLRNSLEDTAKHFPYVNILDPPQRVPEKITAEQSVIDAECDDKKYCR